MAHEHLRIDLSERKGPSVVIGPDDEADVIDDLRQIKAYGMGLVVDLTVPGSGRDVVALKRMADAAQIDVVAATGFYWDPFPAVSLANSRLALAEIMIEEIEAGSHNDGIRCGVIKIGTPAGTPDETSLRIFQAAADAAHATGRSIITHTTSLDQVEWQVETLLGLAVPASRILISHFGKASLDQIVHAGRHGTYMGIDQIGFESGPSYEALAVLVRDVFAEGLGERLIIASDMARRSRLSRYGGTSYGTVHTHFLPQLRAAGVTDAQIATLMQDNPIRLLDQNE